MESCLVRGVRISSPVTNIWVEDLVGDFYVRDPDGSGFTRGHQDPRSGWSLKSCRVSVQSGVSGL